MFDGERDGIWLRDEGLELVREWLLDPEVALIGQNVFYDLGVVCAEDESLIPLVFKAIEADRIHDTILRQKIIDNFYGKLKYVWDADKDKFIGSRYDLGTLVMRYFHENIFAKKGLDENGKHTNNDVWRMRYNELDGVPLEEWPQPAIDYAIEDAVYAYKIFMRQEEEIQPEGIPCGLDEDGNHINGWKHVAHAWGLYLETIRGFRTDPVYTLDLEEKLLAELKLWRTIAQDYGRFIRRGKKESKNLKKIRESVSALVANPLLTKKGQVATTREQLRNIPCPVCGDGFDTHLGSDQELELCAEPVDGSASHYIGLWATSEVTRVEKKLSTYIKVLKQGFDVPINPRYNSIIETFRTSSSSPNIQNYPRGGNIRDCVIPRDGWVFGFCDYDTLEMRTLAQTCIDLFGFSDIGAAIDADEDLHVSLASVIRGESYQALFDLYESGDPGVEKERQFCKCFHPDTEVLTPAGWKKIAELVLGDVVGAAVPDGDVVRIEWQNPIALQRLPADELVHLKCEGIDLRVTRDHRMLAYQAYKPFEETTPEELPKKRGWYNTGKAPGGDWSPDEKLLRLAVAAQADGSLSGHQIRFGFTKQRKIERMRELLQGIPHREGARADGATEFFVFGNSDYPSGRRTEKGIADQVVALLSNKQFDQRWLGLSDKSREIVLDEARYWDATSTGKLRSYIYTTTQLINAEILQLIATLSGRKTALRHDGRVWALTIRDHKTRRNDRSRGDNLKAEIIPYKGEVVCLSVPSSYVVVRDGGIPVVTGQCGNYGLAGGMGEDTLIDYARIGYDIIVTKPKAKELYNGFRTRWSEMPLYFDYISKLVNRDKGYIKHQVYNRSGCVRGRVSYTAGCNGNFQHLAAMGAKDANYYVAKECYTMPTSPLFGCRPWLFAHDEIGLEIPIFAVGYEGAHLAMKRLQEIMISAMKFWCPDVAIGASPAMSWRWIKGAKAVYTDGLLVPSRKEGKKWIPDLRDEYEFQRMAA